MDARPPPPLPQGAPSESYGFVTGMYRRHLRPVVLSFAIIAGIWSLFSAIAFIRSGLIYKGAQASQLALFSILIGALYLVIVVLEIFALFASPSKIRFVRTYAYLSGVVVLITTAIGLIQTAIHFVDKNEIITECSDVDNSECLQDDFFCVGNSAGNTVFYGGIFGPQIIENMTPGDALDWCTNAWNRGSWSTIIAFLITTFLAILISVIAFSYLRQVLNYPVNSFREPAQRRMGNFPAHYSPPFSPTHDNYPSYPAPVGLPPKQSSGSFTPTYDSKPPVYVMRNDYNGGFGEKRKGEFDE